MSEGILKNVKRNRMLKQRETMWFRERQAATEAIKILDNDVNYRMAMNIMGNYICMSFVLWSEDDDWRIRDAMKESLRTEPGLRIWGDSENELSTVKQWLIRGRYWSCEECSELMRLMVAVIENLEKILIEKHDELTVKKNDKKELSEIKLNFLVGKSENYQFKSTGTGTRLKRFKSSYELQSQVFQGFTGKISELKKRKLHNVEIFKKTEKKEKILPVGPRSRDTDIDILSRILSLGDTKIANQRRIARLLANSSGGTNIHSLRPNSLVGTLEWILGLPCGADTSGTTAEVIGICETIRKEYLPTDELDDMIQDIPLYLGPALSMVKNGHHTILECAIPMNIYKNLAYAPGFYSDILPDVDESKAKPLYKNLKSRLADFELKYEDDVAIYKPSTDAWSSDKVNQISLRGGTIMNSYRLKKCKGKNFHKIGLWILLNDITKKLDAKKDLGGQINKIYECVETTIFPTD